MNKIAEVFKLKMEKHLQDLLDKRKTLLYCGGWIAGIACDWGRTSWNMRYNEHNSNTLSLSRVTLMEELTKDIEKEMVEQAKVRGEDLKYEDIWLSVELGKIWSIFGR